MNGGTSPCHDHVVYCVLQRSWCILCGVGLACLGEEWIRWGQHMPRQEQGRKLLNFCSLPVSALDRKDAGCWMLVSHASQGEINEPVCQETGMGWYIKDAVFQGARCSQLYLLLQHLCVCGCVCVYMSVCVHVRITYRDEATDRSQVSSSNI